MWLAETAVDLGTLEVVARQGIAFVILAPWQAEGADPATRQAWTPTPLPGGAAQGRAIKVFFYDANLAGAAHGAGPLTDDPRAFARYALPMRLDNWWWGQRRAISSCSRPVMASSTATIGPDARRWLATLLGEAAPAARLFRYLARAVAAGLPAAVERLPSARAPLGARRHGLVRWMDDCDCVATRPVGATASGSFLCARRWMAWRTGWTTPMRASAGRSPRSLGRARRLDPRPPGRAVLGDVLCHLGFRRGGRARTAPSRSGGRARARSARCAILPPADVHQLRFLLRGPGPHRAAQQSGLRRDGDPADRARHPWLRRLRG